MKILIALVVIVLLAIGGYLASPLFFDRTVDEEFSYMTDDGRVDIDAVLAMPEETRGKMRDDIMAAAAAAPETARAVSSRSGSHSDFPTSTPRAARKVLAMPPPTIR